MKMMENVFCTGDCVYCVCVCVCVCDITEAENSGDEEPGLEYLQKELGPVCCLVVCVIVMCVYLFVCVLCIPLYSSLPPPPHPM